MSSNPGSLEPLAGPVRGLRLLGIDPGSRITGWGLIGGSPARPRLIECGVIRLGSSKKPFGERLAALQRELEQILERLQPSGAAVESPYHGVDARASLRLAHARGVILAGLARTGVPVAEYAPASVKKAVTGSGRAPKEQVRAMVVRLLRCDDLGGPDDLTDALAVALCHAATDGLRRAVERSAAPTRRPGGRPTRPVIGRLTGKVLRCTPGQVLIDVNGVGYEVQIPLSTFYALGGGGSGAPISLHVHTHVREDALSLFGFSSPSERDSFVRLIGISGVGPRLALAILSGIGVDELRAAVASSDRDRLTKIPGVGRKTAERLLLELRDKLDAVGTAKDAAGEAAGSTEGGVRGDAISALENLGYSRDVARRAVDGAADEEGPDASLEHVLRRSLAGLVR